MTARTRRAVMGIVIAISLACLVALAAVPPLRHHALGGGWGIAASAAVSILAGHHGVDADVSRYEQAEDGQQDRNRGGHRDTSRVKALNCAKKRAPIRGSPCSDRPSWRRIWRHAHSNAASSLRCRCGHPDSRGPLSRIAYVTTAW